MIVLGIDPGSRRAGIAVIEQKSPGGPMTMLMAETLRLESIDQHTARLLLIHDSVEEAIRLHKPNLMTIETPVYGLDPLAMLKLGRAQASAILAATRHDLEVREIYPKAVKKAITAMCHGRGWRAGRKGHSLRCPQEPTLPQWPQRSCP